MRVVLCDDVRKFITYIFPRARRGAALRRLRPRRPAIDLGTDTVPALALALGREPAEPGIMRRPPRPRRSGIVQRAMLERAWLRMGLVEAVLAMLGFLVVLPAAGWSPHAPTGAGHPLHHAYRLRRAPSRVGPPRGAAAWRGLRPPAKQDVGDRIGSARQPGPPSHPPRRAPHAVGRSQPAKRPGRRRRRRASRRSPPARPDAWSASAPGVGPRREFANLPRAFAGLRGARCPRCPKRLRATGDGYELAPTSCAWARRSCTCVRASASSWWTT
ncbi:cation-translocating P-type ATPase C-terminal domain-containing protein [Baekduia sp.]|uniref:cation-translocating P-type ATPase C-terminal domain-containing protein n=1 Tax=Baekduia sp. TaxID=2600305 RepID=UPI0032C23F43